MPQNAARVPHPGPQITTALFAALALAMVITGVYLMQVDDVARLKRLVEDDGPVQATGLYAVSAAFVLTLFHALTDSARRHAYLPLSYLLLIYALREADYHYKVSEYAKATQFKRFYLHEMIPWSTKLFMACIVLLFLVTLVYYLRRNLPVLLDALQWRLPWALAALAWAGVFGLSQVIDQLPVFHNETGQVWEEVFEASAEILALMALLLFRFQLAGDRRAGVGSSAASS